MLGEVRGNAQTQLVMAHFLRDGNLGALHPVHLLLVSSFVFPLLGCTTQTRSFEFFAARISSLRRYCDCSGFQAEPRSPHQPHSSNCRQSAMGISDGLVIFLVILGAGAAVVLGYSVFRFFCQDGPKESIDIGGEFNQAQYMRDVRLRNQEDLAGMYGYGRRDMVNPLC